jgi:hypothetical protein
MSGTKNLSTYIVDHCQRNPRLAFLLIPLGGFLAYWGLTEAKFYQSLSTKPTQPMTVTRVYSAPNSRGFSVPFVAGKTPQGEVSFSVSDKAASRIQVGQVLPIVETNKPSDPYVTRETLDGQLSGIWFSVGGYPINAIVLLGAAIGLGGLGWGLFGKPKRAESPVSPANEGDSGPDKSQ